MRVEDIEIIADTDLGHPYRVLGPISARVTAGAAWNKARTVEDVNSKLREAALKLGANAVVNVTYQRGASLTSWKALTAHGTAVIAEADERQCSYCAETIKREARVCRFCGHDVEPLQRDAGDFSTEAITPVTWVKPRRWDKVVVLECDGSPGAFLDVIGTAVKYIGLPIVVRDFENLTLCFESKSGTLKSPSGEMTSVIASSDPVGALATFTTTSAPSGTQRFDARRWVDRLIRGFGEVWKGQPKSPWR